LSRLFPPTADFEYDFEFFYEMTENQNTEQLLAAIAQAYMLKNI
jgi:hypothetical protein